MKKLLMVMMLVVTSNLFALEQGEVAPHLSLTQMGMGLDQDIIVPSEGKNFVVVEFMSINCGPCIQALPVLKMLNNGIADVADLRIVSIDRPSQAVIDFFEGYYSDYFDFPFYGDTEQREAARAFMIRYTPTLFVINGEGEIVYKHVGTLDLAGANHIGELVRN